MKVIPEANNHVKLELDMSTYAPKKRLDVNEGASGGLRFVTIIMDDPVSGNPMEPFTITFTTEDEELKTFTVNSVQISMKRERRKR